MDRSNIPLESAITAQIQRYLKSLLDWWGFKTQGGGAQMRGVPDIVGCFRGLFVGFEVKRPHVGRLSDIQAHRIDQIRAAGGHAYVVTCVEDVARALDSLSADAHDGGRGVTAGG